MIESDTCLLPMVTKQTRLLMRLYKHYGNSVLMQSGGILDQPNFYLEAMETIEKSINS